ncbi:MAG: GNAT family N-acetyltransferase [Candidatus Omnitrophica bacterium]|nr:GNAT family N-acetyltransferase [Candidatus Omnitrophota bacterium]
MQGSPLTASIYRSVDEISVDAWGRIFPSVAENYFFYKVIEKTFPKEYKFYYLAIYQDNNIVCLVPAFVTEFALDTTIKGPLKYFTQKIRKIFPHLFTIKVFICGNPLSAGKMGVVQHNQSQIAHMLEQTITAISQQEKINICAFKDFHQTYTSFLDHLLASRFHKIPSFPSVELKINFKSFDEYLSTLSKSTRKSLKKKFKEIDDQKVLKVEVANNLGDLLDEAYILYLNTLKKSEIQFEILPKSFFKNIAENMPNAAKFFLWKLNGKLVAFDLCLLHDNHLVDEYIGLDYDVAYQYHLYFDSYRVIIKWCIDQGILNYEAGALNYEPKKRLDFTFNLQYIYVKHRNPIINIFIKILGIMLKPENFDPILRSIYLDSAKIKK